MSLTTEFVLVGLITALLVWLWRQARWPANFPPGPWGVPILGALAKLGVHPNKTLVEWKSTYGPIVGLNFVGWRCVAISDYKLMKTVMNDPAYAGRPALTFMSDRSGGQSEGIIFTTGRKWQEQKRFTLRKLRDFGFGTRSMETIVHDEIHPTNIRPMGL